MFTFGKEMKVQKIADIDLSQHPLYSLVSTVCSPSLVCGGLDYFLFRFTQNNLNPLRSLNPLSPQIPEIDKISGLQTSIYTLVEDPESETIWMGGGTGILQGLDLKTQKFKASYPLGNSPIFSIQFYRNQIWIGLGNGQIRILELDSSRNPVLNNEEINSISISEEALRVLAMGRNQESIAIGGKDSMIRIFDPSTFNLLHTLKGHSFPVFSITYSLDGKFLVSGSRDASLKIWDTENYSLYQTIPAHLFAINHILYHPFKPYFFTASMDKSIKVWGSDDFKLYKILDAEKVGGHISSVNRLAWIGKENPVLVSVSDDRRMILWDLEF